jgi:hypothetical protein
VTVAGIDAPVVAGTASSDTLDFLVPAPATGTTWYTGERERVIVTTVAGVTAVLDNELRVVPDEPVALRLDPAVITISGAQDYAKLPISMYGQFLAPPGAVPGTAGAAHISLVSDANTASVNAKLGNKGELIFTLPSDFPVPSAEKSALSVAVVAERGTKRTDPLTLTVELAHPPDGGGPR